MGRAHAGIHDDCQPGGFGTGSRMTDNCDIVERLRRTDPDALVYLGLGVTSRAVALALA